ncbi:MAG TPA: hypothetical protein VF736_07385 [Pyrinomonadaceae bacterium]
MRHVRAKLIASVAALAMWASAFGGIVTAQTPSPVPPGQPYIVVDLTPTGSTTASASGVSGTQQVGSIGIPTTATPSGVSHAVLWNGSASRFVDLGAGGATALRDGQQVGSANDHAALWLGTAQSRVDLNPSGWTQSVATGVGGGQQAGWATRNVPCTGNKGRCGGGGGTRVEIHPFLWFGSAASAVDLTPLSLGYGAGRVLGTDGAQQVGYGQTIIGINAFSGPFAVVWSGTAASAVNLNPPDSIQSTASAVSGGQQVGAGYSPSRALLWSGSAESVVNLHPDGYAFSEASATNGTRQAGFGFVGDADTLVGHKHALVWSGDAASAVDLNQFLPPGFTDAAATGIDAAGNVVGWASKGSPDVPANVHAVMWVPGTASAAFALALNRADIVVGDPVQASVTLSQPAPAGGAVVNLSNVITPPVGVTTPPPFTVQMPSSVTVNEGQTSASFNVATSVTTLNGFSRAYLLDVQAAYGGATQTATLTVNPPSFVSSLSVAPGNVVGGNTAVGTVNLNGPAPQGGALVALSSDSPAATLPASVLIPEGQSGATFNVTTNVVTVSTTATLAATYGSSISATVTAPLVVAPKPTTAADVVAIQKAEYVASKRQLTVQASSTSPTATLTVSETATAKVIGVLTNKGGGKYEGTFTLAANPQNITVTSNLQGTARRAVDLK